MIIAYMQALEHEHASSLASSGIRKLTIDALESERSKKVYIFIYV
jgi:hypothetical protein